MEEEKVQKRIEEEDREFLEQLDEALAVPEQKTLGDAVREVLRMSEKCATVPSQVIYAIAGVCFICRAKIPLPEPPNKKLIFTDVLCEACNKSVW